MNMERKLLILHKGICFIRYIKFNCLRIYNNAANWESKKNSSDIHFGVNEINRSNFLTDTWNVNDDYYCLITQIYILIHC